MKSIVVVVSVLVIIFTECSTQLENLINTDMHKCIECLCHATTGCYQRSNCARYSISYDYWQRAGSPTLNVNDPENMDSYMACMSNENCILNTIKLYTDSYGRPQCDCNDIYDCRDMLMIHLNHEACTKTLNDTSRRRYNDCASRRGLARIDSGSRCSPPAQ